MAPFTNTNPPGYGPDSRDPNWLNQSKEPSRRDIMASETGFGDVLSSLGSIVDKAAKGFDAGIEAGMQKDARELIEPIRQDNTVRNLGAAEGNPIDILPPAAQTQIKGLSKNEQRRAAGGMSETDYNIQLLNAVKQLRAKYPGYVNEIDQSVARITGVNPANELRSQALKNLTDTQNAAKAKQADDNAWYEKNKEHIYLFVPSTLSKEHAIAQRSRLEPLVGQHVAAKEQLEYNTKVLAHSEKIDENTQKDLYRNANMTAQAVVKKAFMTAGAQGKNFWEFYQSSQKTAMAGGVPDAKTVSALQQQALALRQNLKFALDQEFAKEYAPGRTYNSMLKPEQIKAIYDQQLGQMDSIIAILGSGKGEGFAAIGANILAMQNNQIDLVLGERYSSWKVLGAANRIAGSETAASMLRMSGQVLKDAEDAMKNHKLIFGNVTGVPGEKPDSMPKIIQDGAKAEPGGRMSGAKQNLLLNQFLTLAKDKDPTIRGQALDVLYSDPSWFAGLPLVGKKEENSKHAVWLRMTSPDMLKAVIEQEKSEPGAMDRYVNWLRSSYPAIFKQSVDDLQRTYQNGLHEVTVDPKTGNISVQLTPEALSRTGGNPNDRAAQAQLQQAQNQQTYVQRFNQGINTLMPALEAKFGPEGAKREMLNILRAAGYDPNVPVTPGVLGIIGNAFKKFDQAIQDQHDSVAPAPRDDNPDPHGRNKPTDVSGAKRSVFKVEDEGSRIEGTKLSNVIDRQESKGDYNVVLGNRRRPLTDMTIDEVLDWQKKDRAQTGAPSAAAGRSQIVETTLRGLKRDMGLKGTEKFDEAMQDQMRDVLLERRGLNKFLAGEMTAKQFITNLRNEWDGLNKVSDRELLAAVMGLSVELGKPSPAGR